MEGESGLLECLREKIADGHSMVERLKLMGKIDGIDKLTRKIQQEIKFLEKVQRTGTMKKEHIQSTNLIHLSAMVARLSYAQDPASVMKPFKYQDSRLEVDIVCNRGASWIKVVARNAKALTLISLGKGEYGQKSVLDQANSYLMCSKCHWHRYRPPDVIFHFACGIEIPLAQRLEQMGIIVEGERIDIDSMNSSDTIRMVKHDELDFLKEPTDDSERDSNIDLQSLNGSVLSTEIKFLNLDVSTLLAYVTNMSNGHSSYIYREPLLTQQAEMERKRPIKPILDNLFRDKELIVCRTAYDNFMSIMNVIGGPQETQRAHELMKQVRIVDDMPAGRFMEKLRLGGKIKDRSRLVFATGENMKSITVSANEGFVRAASMQGIECTVFLHEPRSLSEIKEGNAMSIQLS